MKKKIGIKIIKIIGIITLSILALLFLIPIFFSEAITDKVKVIANENLDAKLDFENTEVSFFKHFPSLTLTIENVNLNGSSPFKEKPLIKAKEIAFGVNLKSLIFGTSIVIDAIYVNDATINILVDKNGNANYNIYKSKSSTTQESKSKNIDLRNLSIINSNILYSDQSAKIVVDAKGFNYKGIGKLEENNLLLNTDCKINDFTFRLKEESYVEHKSVKADLITKINTKSLAFIFEKNNLMINNLPVEFKGFFDFISGGYDMLFDIKTKQGSKLRDAITALPKVFTNWLTYTKVEGDANAELILKGKYISSKNMSPDLSLDLQVRKGFISYKGSPFAANNIYLNLKTKLPSLDINQLNVKLDSLFFNVGKDYFSAIVNSQGFTKKMDLNAIVKSKLDLQKFKKAIGFNGFDINGILNVNLASKGLLNIEQKIFPPTNGYVDFKNGYLKTNYYPNPIQNITINTKIDSPTTSLQDASITILPSSFLFEGKPFNCSGTVKNFNDINYIINAKGTINISRVYKVFSRKGLDIDGKVYADVHLQGKQSDATQGRINKLNNSGTLIINNIKTKTSYLPLPFTIVNGVFKFDKDKLWFTNFNGKYGKSNVTMNGYLQNVINYVISKKQVLKGNFTFHTDYLNVNEFLSSSNVENKQTESSSEGTTKTKVVKPTVFEVPKNLSISFVLNAKKIVYDKLNIDDVKGNMIINNGIIVLNNGELGMAGATANMNLKYKDITPNKAEFDYTINAKDFDIKKAYNEVEMFKNLASAAKDAEGIVSLDYKLKGLLNNEMKPIMPSLKGEGVLSVKNVKMKGFKLMNVVSAKSNHEDLKNPNLENIDIKTKIKNNIINIEQFKFKTSGFRIRVGGQTSLDGKLNLKMRIGLPPLGIIGIPIKVRGTSDKPKVGLGRSGEDLEETTVTE